ncbi:MAG: YeeE/YedE family protein [Pseudohongiellaceae bacterium]
MLTIVADCWWVWHRSAAAAPVNGICGLARFSRRSFTATVVFMLTAIVTVYLTRHVLGILP